MSDEPKTTLRETLADWFLHLEAENECPGGYERLFVLEDGRLLRVTLKAEPMP